MHPNPNILTQTEIDRDRFVRSGAVVTVSLPKTEDAVEISTVLNDSFHATEARLDRLEDGTAVLRLTAGYTTDTYLINERLAQVADHYGLTEIRWTHGRDFRAVPADAEALA